METLLHIMLLNAFGTAVLAIIAWPLCIILRKPAVTRALWIIVLLKLLSPPVLSIPIDRLLPQHRQVVTLTVEPIRDVQPLLQEPILPTAPLPRPAAAPKTTDWLTKLPLIWASGSALLLTIGLLRIGVLLRILRKAQLAPSDVQWVASEIANRFGITRAPQVWFVPGVVCPALWAFGRRARVIVPVSLWFRLDGQQRQTLLAHELAHLRRRDHWVRLLEFVTSVLYWWHPAVWFARRQIHDCEEQCCDAWVLWAMPASAHSYGSALLEAVDYVSTYRPMQPALAAGLGEFRHLKRRLLMIKQGTVSRALSRTGLASICAAAAFALPLAPGFAQESPPAALPGVGALPDAAATANRVEIEQARAIVAHAQIEVQQARARLAQATSLLAVLEHGSAEGTVSGAGGGHVSAGGGHSGGDFSVASGNKGVSGGGSGTATGTRAPLGGLPADGNVIRSDGGGSISFSTAGAGNGQPGGMGYGVVIRGGSAMPGSNGAPGSGTIGGGRAMGGGGGGGFGGGGSSSGVALPPTPGGGGGGMAGFTMRPDSERRLAGLEQQLKELMDQVRDLKDLQRQQQKPGDPAGQPPVSPGEKK